MLFDFHEGITGIVGPNGSGKSNVSDAVRWVLGEQSARQLRGGNMQDVIFAGTETRKPQSFAAVSITFDNSDHALDIDFEEVTVTRRLYRSGESEYKINNSTVRLRDIHELFYDTGIGKEGYSIIGQGQIERIISEQANLLRVNDILTEISGRLGPLKKQSEVAKVYLEKRDTLRELDVNLFLIDNERIGKELQEIEGKVKIADDQIAEISDAHNTGQHTTTFSEMISLSETSGISGESGYLIDTPGIKGFGTFDMEPEEITSYFKEIFRFAKD